MTISYNLLFVVEEKVLESDTCFDKITTLKRQTITTIFSTVKYVATRI